MQTLLPEGLFRLMMVGEIPTIENVRWLSAEWRKGSEELVLSSDALPKKNFSETQFSILF
ncbi:MAG: hypothetical protein IPO92_11600 [Saprospiraceae bacterium]|nr:hypothetical protein [Saprospiraceae bacterium]